ncbi:YtxH domain-containing protein [Bacillus rubiinfantis]|uniref:YtxH domain-containing protein n=1 Tax=Bacillus rubiinfantis TaxID=1499680 RepID=UPI0005A5ED66|nr:YtxH domain-containing protein [Bacillus rubiinfantis]
MGLFRSMKEKIVDIKDEAEYKMYEWGVDEKLSSLKNKVVDKVEDIKLDAEIFVDDVKDKVGDIKEDVKDKLDDLKIDTEIFIDDMKEKVAPKPKLPEEEKYVILEDMDEVVKINYIKILIHLGHADGELDQKELVELYSLMGQLNFNVEQRMIIREYMTQVDVELEALLSAMDEKIPEGSEEVLHLSLIKNGIRLAKVANNRINEAQFAFIKQIAHNYQIGDDKVFFLEEACELDEKILNGSISNSDIIKNSKAMAAKAGAVGVPMAAVYLSGTAGLSAAGITSGLAGLGLGGVLGLSSMVTGIGVVVLIGVGAYKTVKWATNNGQREIANKREYLIRQVIINSQNTINYLIEDINYFTTQVLEIAEEAEMNRQRLAKVVREIRVLKDAITTMRGREMQLQEGIQYEEA